ncbi:MAG: NAD+ synthase [Sulfuriflexus sp.]|nr:NAD+ synthase [Sulfuriflexus sp.]
MSDSLRIVMAQLNMLLGDIDGNVQQIINAANKARDELNADAIVFPELTLTGYPPEDLLLRPGFTMAALRGLERVKQSISGIDVVIGYPIEERAGLYNAAALIRDGKIIGSYHKQHLPNYSVFDEKRYFVAGQADACVVEIKGVPVAITICEDIWLPSPMQQAADAGAKLMLNLNASPFHINKQEDREAVLYERATEANMPIVYVNLVGGQDELVFDGGSMVVNGSGEITQRAESFEIGLFPVEFAVHDDGNVTSIEAEIAALPSEDASAYQALVLGVRDYVTKNGFEGVVLGLSGGIDSALTLAVAVDALGADRVEAVSMPSRYTADMSVDDALEEAKSLGVACKVIAIEKTFTAFLESLADEFADTEKTPGDVTEQNLQARCRGVLLMAIANKKHRIVLTTGNKSEMAVGYATLYGDMAGGFDVLKDVPKLLVYRLSKYRNSLSPVIPERVITRPPTAELAPDQKDEDSLPAYEILDPILALYVEQDKTLEEIVAEGFEQEIVARVISMVDRNEYKRRQAAPGVRITQKAFGRDRRYPITSHYRSGKCG